MLWRFRNKVRYWSKTANFSYLLILNLHDPPVPLQIFAILIQIAHYVQVPELLDVPKLLPKSSTLWGGRTNVTDDKTDDRQKKVVPVWRVWTVVPARRFNVFKTSNWFDEPGQQCKDDMRRQMSTASLRRVGVIYSSIKTYSEVACLPPLCLRRLMSQLRIPLPTHSSALNRYNYVVTRHGWRAKMNDDVNVTQSNITHAQTLTFWITCRSMQLLCFIPVFIIYV